MSVKIKKNRFSYNSKGYFRGGAEDVVLACYGEKKSPVNGGKYLDVSGEVPEAALAQVKVLATPVDIDWSRQSRSEVDVDAAPQVLKLAGAKVNFKYNMTNRADLKLVKLTIRKDELAWMLNEHAPRAIRSLASNGQQRVVSAVWVVMEAELANKITSGAGLELEATVEGVDLKFGASGGGNRGSRVKLSKGTTFAYFLHKVRRWNNGRTEILDLEDDQYGLG